MDEPDLIHTRCSGSRPRDNGHHNGVCPRRSSTTSSPSFMGEIEMAHDEVFAGPVSESIPSSITSYGPRRNRGNSDASSTNRVQDDNDNGSTAFLGNGTVQDDICSDHFEEESVDLEAGELAPMKRASSVFSGRLETYALLRRDSMRTEGSSVRREERTCQKIYVANEDLTIVFTGYRTASTGLVLYACLCAFTFGLGYLFLRWFPRWRVHLVGLPTPLHDSSWVVIENQWSELSLHNVLVQHYGKSLSTVFGCTGKQDAIVDDDNDPLLQDLRIINYRYMRFCFHPLRDKFILINGWKDPAWANVKAIRTGIDGEEKEKREIIFGKNLIDIEEKSIPQLLADEAFHPFYIFQIASLILWSLDEYYYYAGCIFLISAASIITTLIETRSTMKRLREISRFECDVRVLRNGFWRYITSSDLVPGDIYELTDPNLSHFPCDSILLAGDCIVNESMLTGESVPVSKAPISNESFHLMDLAATSIEPKLARHFLFCGTKIIRARRPQNGNDDEAVGIAMVLRTGFNTTKGALVRSMLFPKPSGFKFYRDSFRYISVMGCIATVGFVTSLINFVLLRLTWHLIIIRALDLITIVVPPALPATLMIGTNFALSRLRKKEIYCISPQRINVGGKLDVICFDKTGTLTEDGLDVLGVHISQRPGRNFSSILCDPQSLLPRPYRGLDPTVDYKVCKAILFTMATCHSIRVVGDELVGDPLDLKMFEFTGWSLEESGRKNSAGGGDENQNGLSPSIVRPPTGIIYDLNDDSIHSATKHSVELGILKSFEFISQLRRASVIVRNFSSKHGDIYVKGAPECVKDICRADTLPSDYEELLAYYTHRGYRVIACATKHIPKLSWLGVQKMKREDAESNLEFLGFIIFENKLKPSTAEVLHELGAAGIRKVMCTGDNTLTAVSVARECSLINKTEHCFVPHFVEGDSQDPQARLAWECIDNCTHRLDEYGLTPLSLAADYSLAISGDVFRWIVDYGPPELLKRMLICGQVFARMSPDEKHELVERLQSLDYCCGFCGDGANDCGALKAADVGISLSDAEASVAAPFTSRVFDITCVPEIIREGRAALVTSFSCFKYMSLYSAIQFTSVSFLYASASNLGDFQFLFIDLLLILPIAIFMGWTNPHPVLSNKRPTASLVSRKVLTPLLGQIIICILIQAAGFIAVRRQSWYIPPHLDKQKSNIKNSENTTLFLVSCFEYIFSGVVLSVGPPFRQVMFSNLPFVITIAVTLFVSSYMLLVPFQWLADFMQLTGMAFGFRIFVFILGIGYFVLSWSGERYIFPTFARILGSLRLKPKRRKSYKLVQEEMRIYSLQGLI